MPTHASNDTATHSGVNVYLQSKDGLSTDNNSNCNFYLDTIITPDRADLGMMVSVIDAEIPYSFYNITAKNNSLTLNDIVLELTERNYNAYNIVDEFNSLFKSKPTLSNVVMSFDDNSNKFTITSPSEVTLVSTTMSEELGATNLPQTTDSYTSNQACNLSGTSSIYIRSDNMNVRNINSFGKNNGVLSKVLVTSPPGNFIFYQPSTPQYFVLNNPLSYINIQMLNDDNEFIDFDGLNWSLTLSIEFFRKRDDSINYKYYLDGVPDNQIKDV